MDFKRILFIFLLISLTFSGFSQVIYEYHTNEVYNFLARQAQKGVLVWDDLIRPVSKEKIKQGLDSVQAHYGILSKIEKAELSFYQREFTIGVRKRMISAHKDDFSIQLDPILTASYLFGSGKDIKTTSGGFNVWGNAGKKWGYQFSFHDINANGSGFDTSYKTLDAGSATGPILINGYKSNSQNNLEIRGHISFAFTHGSISVGQDYLLWGYGENGRIVLSDKAPTYPYIRLDYQPLPWLRFNYTHAWLQSGLIDSARSYSIPTGIFGGIRDVFISKYMASHSLDITLTKGLNFSIGESIIYNDKLNIGYLVPVMFFKAVDNSLGSGGIQRGSNGQFFFQASSRNQLPNTHLYGTLFIDEIKISDIFNKDKQRNQLGYNIGASITDIAGISYLTVGAEYTRIRPFVYRNFLPAQNYTNAGYLLGDWMGNNADRVLGFVKYTPLPKLKLEVRYSHIRKGGEGTLDQQYQQVRQPDFLFDFQRTADELFLSASYEYLNRLYINTSLRRLDGNQYIFIGMTYGL